MDSDEEVAIHLHALAVSPEHRSKSGRLRTLLPAIEAALNAGVGLELILTELNTRGLNMTFGSFKSTLYRIRQEKKRSAPVVAAVPLASLPPKHESVTFTDKVEKREQILSVKDEEYLSPREKREKLASQFITPELSNPLLKRFLRENKN